jgi:hypothetical protein
MFTSPIDASQADRRGLNALVAPRVENGMLDAPAIPRRIVAAAGRIVARTRTLPDGQVPRVVVMTSFFGAGQARPARNEKTETPTRSVESMIRSQTLSTPENSQTKEAISHAFLCGLGALSPRLLRRLGVEIILSAARFFINLLDNATDRDKGT